MFSKMLSGLTAIVLSLAAASAFAGPDWAAIERARAERKAQTAAPATATAEAEAGEQKVVPVNHGPRAEFRPSLGSPAADAAIMAPTNVARQ
ncbi:hypothetical protein [Azoarcus olearius]|uniref:Hypothetical secreted protein n=1 Tax=Azoarcus sp. (strain BH72) TaxID=418699 RepID=A1KA75_AZOSB|nr:hypothetical protein [Azoarcus olearius]CAL95731.1 hypothetical secreted protein [Azoarcus olearius]